MTRRLLPKFEVSNEEAIDFRNQLEKAQQREAAVAAVLREGAEVGWAPQKGSQEEAFSCPAFEVLGEGPRGGGKTDWLIFSFAAFVGRGYGNAWRGVLFRQSYPQLADVVAKTQKWFPLIWGGDVKFNEQKMIWRWKTGEVLLLRHMRRPSDYNNYHGHEYPWIGWEELTNWPDDVCYKMMLSCSRSTKADMPRMVRATTNPYGSGHGWVKQRFRLMHKRGKIFYDEDGNTRCPIFFPMDANKLLLAADPNYVQKVVAAARNDAQKEAWLNGSWDIVAGGMFDEAWFKASKYIVIPTFRPGDIPSDWIINRSYDHGESKPFSVGWWAQSTGSEFWIEREDRLIRSIPGDLFRFREWYGCRKNKPNEGLGLNSVEIAEGIIRRELEWGIYGIVHKGPADDEIFYAHDGNCVAKNMRKRVLLDGEWYNGVKWKEAGKKPHSRVPGWDELRIRMLNTIPSEEGIREFPGVFVCDCCEGFTRTVPKLTRSESDPDDVDKNNEDHIADEVRYRIMNKPRIMTPESF